MHNRKTRAYHGGNGGEPLLSVSGLQAWYGDSHVLHGIDFAVGAGEVVSLLGRNGAGKTTTLKAIMGMLERREGSVRVGSVESIKLPSWQIARLGVGYVPEERGIYASLSVEENLLLPPEVKPGGMSKDQILAIFPNLKERMSSQGTTLSGGEQQMLAIGRALMGRPRLLLLDEPSMGLAPLMVEKVFEVIRTVAAQGVTILLVEQNARLALEVCSRGYVMESGRVTLADSAANLAADPRVRHAYLGE